MRTYHPAILMALLTTVASAQNSATSHRLGNAVKQVHHPVTSDRGHMNHPIQRDVIWSDDLSDPATWVSGTGSGRDPDTWVIGTAGPTGTYSQSYGTLASTTAANGFALFDSDRACGGNQEATLRTANPVDLSAYPGALLQFEQLFSRFRGDCYVDISSDATNWTSYLINEEVNVNASTANPDLREVNISAFGGEQTVYIRFRYYSTEAFHGAGAGCDYAWMIDDVALVTLPDHDMAVDLGYVSQTASGEEYGRVPLSQWVPSLLVGAEVNNYGGQPQTNVLVDIACTAPDGTEVFTVQHFIGNLDATDTIVTSGQASIPDPMIGAYTVTYTVTSDQAAFDSNTENDSRMRKFQATDHIYSLDNVGGHPPGYQILQQVGTRSFLSNAENVKLMNFYVIHHPMTVTGMEIGLGPASEAGARIAISILDTTDIFRPNPVVNEPLVESDQYTLTQAQVAAGKVTIEFPGPYTLQPGAYYAVASLFAVGDNDVYVLDDRTVPQPNAASMVWLPFDPGTNQHLYGGNGTAWAVRLTSDPTIGLEEYHELNGISMYPNPTSNSLRITTRANVKHTVLITDMMGALVRTTTFNGSDLLDLSDLAPGVYAVQVSDGTKKTVRQVMVAH
jgi:hypothetical protein